MMIFTTSAPPNRVCIGLGPGADQVLRALRIASVLDVLRVMNLRKM